jgi:para-nitrobenzyl esterase
MSLAQFANAMPPFTPVADHVLFGDEIVPAALAGAAERDVLVGHTRDEMAAFFVIDERVKNASPEAVAGRFRDYFGAAAGDAAAEYRRRARGDAPAQLLGELTGDALFAAGTWEFGERLAALGRPAFVYRFDFAPPGNAFVACHCSELPFVFDNLDNWNAPMLAGGDSAVMRRLGDQVQDAWIAFARSGNPSHAGLPPWPHFDLGPDGARRTMVFDADSRVVADPAGRARWRHWA